MVQPIPDASQAAPYQLFPHRLHEENGQELLRCKSKISRKNFLGILIDPSSLIQQRIICFFYGITFVSFAKFCVSFSAQKTKDPNSSEIYFRLNSIFAKNKYGYNTRFMSDFDLLLESALNERFIDESTLYYDNPIKAKEIEDMEQGLNGEFAEDDIKDLIKDKQDHASR